MCERQLRERLGRERGQVVERHRRCIRPVEDRDVGPREPRQRRRRGVIEGYRVIGDEACEAVADKADRRVARRTRDQVVDDEIVEAGLADELDQRDELVAEHVADPKEVQVGVDAEALADADSVVADEGLGQRCRAQAERRARTRDRLGMGHERVEGGLDRFELGRVHVGRGCVSPVRGRVGARVAADLTCQARRALRLGDEHRERRDRVPLDQRRDLARARDEAAKDVAMIPSFITAARTRALSLGNRLEGAGPLLVRPTIGTARSRSMARGKLHALPDVSIYFA